MMPKKYTDKNLIKYADTIQRHFDESCTTAWLTLKNYRSVFNKKSPDEVTEVRRQNGVILGYSSKFRQQLKCRVGLLEAKTGFAVYRVSAEWATNQNCSFSAKGAQARGPQVPGEPGNPDGFRS